MPVIVIESPNKVKKLAQISGMKVMATVGHFMDLPRDDMGIDLDNNYKPTFKLMDKKKEVQDKLKSMCKDEIVFIASDPDREGYAIGTMVYNQIKSIAKETYRLEINEITENGFRQAMTNKKKFSDTNKGLYDAFLGRRVGDRIVGYIMSPIANREIRKEKGVTFSVGRVQSPSVRLIVDIEKEISNFKPETFYNLILELEKNIKFIATYSGGKFNKKENADIIVNKIKNATSVKTIKVDEKETKQSPKAPFTTVDMLAASAAQLKFSTDKTTKLAQQLFEVGLITYIRTDSVRIAPEFIEEIRLWVGKMYGKDYLPSSPNIYKSKHSQADAHEGIRPTHMHSPESCFKTVLSESLSEDHCRLYELIYRRAVASQMIYALYDSVNYQFECEGEKFKSTGRTLKFDGFLKLWQDSEEERDNDKKEEEDNKTLPKILNGESVDKIGEKITEGQTKPPSRYSETSLVKKLEELGIGRPSTYSSIVYTIKERDYVKTEKGRLAPTKKGELLIDYLFKTHPWVIDYEMTKNMEVYLDKVEEKENGFLWDLFVKSLHSKMGFLNPSNPNSFPPADNIIAWVKDIALKQNIEIPEEALTSSKSAYDFINKYKVEYKPSEKIVAFAESLQEKTGIKIPKDAYSLSKLMSEYIEKAKKANDKLFKERPLSEKQLEIIEKYAPEDLKKKIKKGNNIVARKFIDDYFKKKK